MHVVAFPMRSRENGWAIVGGLRELGFALTDAQVAKIVQGKNFIQWRNGPFDVDLVSAPHGIACLADAWDRRVEVEGFPIRRPDDIIAGKQAASRAKDRESLPRLTAFRDHWRRTRP